MSSRTRASLLALFLAALLAGCGEKSEPETTGPVVTTKTTTQKQPAPTSTTSTTTTEQKGSDPGGKAPASVATKARARLAIETFLTAGDPVVCEQLATARFIRSAYGDLKGCEAAQRPGAAATAVRIGGLKVEEGSATATAVPRGGTNAGERLQVRLVGQGGSWRIDSLRSNAPVGP